MLTRFTSKEIDSLEVVYCGEKTFTADFIKARDGFWEDFVKEKTANGYKVWNGKVYCLNRLQQYDVETVKMYIQSCDYKNYAFILNKGVEEIKEKYGLENIVPIMTIIALIQTTDGKYIFGIRNNKTAIKSGLLGVIGGSLNMDEMEINSFDDFRKYLRYEIEEETKIEISEENMEFVSINYFKTICQLVFKVKSKYLSEEVNELLKSEEFSELITLDAFELERYEGESMLAVQYLKNWIELL